MRVPEAIPTDLHHGRRQEQSDEPRLVRSHGEVHGLHPGKTSLAQSGIPRSPAWPRVHLAHLALHPTCACCDASAGLNLPVQVHHTFPIHECIALGRPDLELDPRNLITLCESTATRPAQDHHLLVGHLGSFQSSNLDVVGAAASTFHGMTAFAIRQNEVWFRAAAERIKPLQAMTSADREDFARKMNARFPKLG
jgi:hypothetical protein